MTKSELGKKAIESAAQVLGAGATKNAVISAAIVALIAGGLSHADAMDAVLGEGTHERLVSDLYGALRAKAA